MTKVVTFLLPGSGSKPVGGFKVVYEYANHLTNRGYKVNIIHFAHINYGNKFTKIVITFIKFLLIYASRSYYPKWFKLNPSINVLWKPTLDESNIPDSDYIIATAWQTAEWFSKYPVSKGRKYYLIQHFETWTGDEDKIIATWRSNAVKIVISQWLWKRLLSVGVDSHIIQNGLNFQELDWDVPSGQRHPYSVMMMHHEEEWKGSGDGLQAVLLLKKAFPQLKVAVFGVPKRPKDWPVWIDYYCMPDRSLLRRLYNETSVFIAPSWTEGWGLPGSEALQCGCALVATDIDGHREYAIDYETALLCSPRNPHDIADKVSLLLNDKELRNTLAVKGYNYICGFTWERASDKLIHILKNDSLIT